MTCNTEGHPIHKPPFFDGTNYTCWKTRMKIFIQSLNVDVWRVIQQGPYAITKPESEWNEEDFKKIQLNSKAIHYLFCSVNPQVFKKICRYDSAKEMWEKLEAIYEEIKEVRDLRKQMLIHEYEIFKMEEDEGVEDMFGRFENIVYDLEIVGKCYSNEDLVRKVLRSLTSPWEAKVVAMKESGKVDTITFDELRGKLIVFEEMDMRRKKNFQKKNAYNGGGNRSATFRI